MAITDLSRYFSKIVTNLYMGEPKNWGKIIPSFSAIIIHECAKIVVNQYKRKALRVEAPKGYKIVITKKSLNCFSLL